MLTHWIIRETLKIFYFYAAVYKHISKSVNVFLEYNFMTYLQIFLLINFYLNNFFRLPMNTLHWLTIIKQYRNINIETKIILSFLIELPSAHHNTNIVSVHLFVPVFHNFPVMHPLIITHIYTYVDTFFYRMK